MNDFSPDSAFHEEGSTAAVKQAVVDQARATREAPLVTIALDTPVDYSGRSFDPDGPEPAPDVTVLDLIIREAARQVISDAESSFGHRHVHNSLLDIVRAEVTSQAKARAEAIVTEALERPFRATNHFGEPVGEETTIRAMIETSAQQFLRGHMPDTRPGYQRQGDKPQGAPAVVDALVRGHLKGELEDAVTEATKTARETVKIKASEIVGQAIADGLRFA